MPDEKPTVPSQPESSDSKIRSTLIFGAVGLFAALVFGLLYLFVIAPSVPNGSLGWYLFSFATGLTMIVMPCTLPLAFVIVPLSMGKGVMRGLGMALAFGIGVAITLSLYGLAAALFGSVAIDYLGADIEVLKNWIYFFAGTLALIFALSEIGLLNVHMPTYSGAAPAFIQKRSEIVKALSLGLFLGNVGVGCPHPATPLILIEIASSGDVLYGWTMFLTHAIGRIIPLLLLAFLAILGINGLNWLMTRKATVERVTGWAMVFVAGFILTLGLFTHDWWVNSGIHSGLEAITQESFFNAWFNEALDQNVAHSHGLEEGAGLFGQPLQWGHWFLVLVWLIPIWWWWLRKKKKLEASPAFALTRLQHELDTVEGEIRAIEATAKIDELDGQPDIAALETQMDELKKQRRAAAKKVSYGETGVLKDETARVYESKILGMHRNYLIAISIFLALVFIYFLPENFYLKSTSSGGEHHGAVVAPTSQVNGTPFTTDIVGLPEATGPLFVELADGDTYDIAASYVQKEVGNRTLRMLAYNGSVPGPFIKVKKGAVVTVNFTNNSDIDQTIHSHGLRLDNRFDGVPDVTQDAVKPGETFVYTLSFPDEGIAWYHPHTRDDYGQEMGLYGTYVVDPIEPGYWSPTNREVPLVIDDILIENGQIATFYKDVIDHALIGRFGNTYLVNGEEDYVLDVEKGEVIRFMVTNVSNARTYRLSIPGAELKLVGAEWGRYEQEEYSDTVVISPAERMVVEAYFPKSGIHRLMNNMPSGPVEMALFNVSDDAVATSYVDSFNRARRNSDVKAEFDAYRAQYLNKAPDKNALLTVSLAGGVDHSAHAHGATTGTVDESMPHGHDAAGGSVAMDMSNMGGMMTSGGLESIQWDDPANSDKVNTTTNVEWQIVDQDTGKVGMGIDDWTFQTGEFVKIRFSNDAMAMHVMQHPIHFHGQRFLVLSENGVPNDNMAWKDTALVLPGEYIDILVEMNNPGEWMAHCHISEHLHAGMMFGYRVEDQNGYAPGDEYRATKAPSAASQQSSSNTGMPMGGSMPMNDMTALPYAFDDESPIDMDYIIDASPKSMQASKNGLISLSFYDTSGNPLVLDETVDQAVSITFVRSDNNVKFVTYPGNSIFPSANDFNLPGMPGFDESVPHSHDTGMGHSFLSIPVAYAHGGVDDGHTGTGAARSYSVPVTFPTSGIYQGFVSFKLPNDPAPHIGVITVEVGSANFSIDNFGWSPAMKWWILLIASLLLTAPLVWGVRKYVNVEKT